MSDQAAAAGETYGALFSRAYGLLHGGDDDWPGAPVGQRRPGEGIEDYLARRHRESLAAIRAALNAAQPPAEVRRAHEILLRLLSNAAEAEEALVAQTASYRCGQFAASVAHSERLHQLVAESARLDRELILALEEAEHGAPGTLAALGLPLPPTLVDT